MFNGNVRTSKRISFTFDTSIEIWMHGSDIKWSKQKNTHENFEIPKNLGKKTKIVTGAFAKYTFDCFQSGFHISVRQAFDGLIYRCKWLHGQNYCFFLFSITRQFVTNMRENTKNFNESKTCGCYCCFWTVCVDVIISFHKMLITIFI